jgi:hypothetical protein
MSAANDALMRVLGEAGFALDDDVFLTAANTNQATGYPIKSEVTRITASPANGALVMKQSASGDMPPIFWIINESGQTIKAFPFTGELQGGVANASLSIPNGQAGIFIRIPPQNTRGGGGGGTLDTRSAVIP